MSGQSSGIIYTCHQNLPERQAWKSLRIYIFVITKATWAKNKSHMESEVTHTMQEQTKCGQDGQACARRKIGKTSRQTGSGGEEKRGKDKRSKYSRLEKYNQMNTKAFIKSASRFVNTVRTERKR